MNLNSKLLTVEISLVQGQILVELSPPVYISIATPQIVHPESIELVPLVLIFVLKIGAIKIVETVRQLVARKGIHDEITSDLRLFLIANLHARGELTQAFGHQAPTPPYLFL